MVDTAPAVVSLLSANGEAAAAPADKAGAPPAPDPAPQQDGLAAMMVDGAVPNGSAGACAGGSVRSSETVHLAASLQPRWSACAVMYFYWKRAIARYKQKTGT